MTELQDSQIVQILPECFKNNPDVQALSFALGRAVKKFVQYCKKINVFSSIDIAEDAVLDMLALELETQYYDDSSETVAKRELIKSTLAWYMTAGTPAAVEELIAMVLGHGELQEWFQYGGKPYTFRVVTKDDADYKDIEYFEKLVKKVKNIRSHLEELMFLREQETPVYISMVNIAKNIVKIGWKEYGDI